MQVLRMFGALHFLAERGDEAGDRHAVGGRRIAQPARVDHDFQRRAVDRGGADFGDDSKRALRLGQRALDDEHRADLGAVGEQAVGLTCIEELVIDDAVVDGTGHQPSLAIWSMSAVSAGASDRKGEWPVSRSWMFRAGRSAARRVWSMAGITRSCWQRI